MLPNGPTFELYGTLTVEVNYTLDSTLKMIEEHERDYLLVLNQWKL